MKNLYCCLQLVIVACFTRQTGSSKPYDLDDNTLLDELVDWPWAVAPLSPSQLLHDIHEAIANNSETYVIPPGLYNFSSMPELSFTLSAPFNFLLSGYGVLFIFAPKQGVMITNCTNATLTGLTVDYSPLAFTQGAVSETEYFPGYHILLTYLLKLEDGYPSIESISALGESKTYFYNSSTRLLFHEQVETSPVLHNFTSLGQGLYRVWSSLPSTLLGWHPPKDGVLASISACPNPAFQCQNCANLTLVDITIHSSSGMGYVEMGGPGGTIIKRWNAIPAPSTLPPSDRLLVTTLDGIHSTSVEKGLLLEDSNVGFSGDDAFAVHCELGITWGVPTEGNNTDLWIIDTGGNIARTIATAQPGDELLFFALNETMTPLGSLVVANNVIELNSTLQAQAANATADIQHQLHLTIRPLTANSTLLMRLSFREDVSPSLKPRFSALVQFSGRCGSGTIVRNTSFHDTSGGMRLKGVNTLVENSVVSRAYGMRMLPEPFWTQSLAFNLQIINNTFHNCGNSPAAPNPIEYNNETCTGLVLVNNTFLNT